MNRIRSVSWFSFSIDMLIVNYISMFPVLFVVAIFRNNFNIHYLDALKTISPGSIVRTNRLIVY